MCCFTSDTFNAQSGKFKRVPPSQINRDRMRAQNRKLESHESDQDPLPHPPEDITCSLDTTITKAHGHHTASIPSIKTKTENHIVNQHVSPPVTRSKARLLTTSSLPQVDSEHESNINNAKCPDQQIGPSQEGITNNIDCAISSEAPKRDVGMVTLYSGYKRHDIRKECERCKCLLGCEDVIQCCFECKVMFCYKCVDNTNEHDFHKEYMKPPWKLIDYYMDSENEKEELGISDESDDEIG